MPPKELSVNLQLCKKNYRNTWEAEAMGFSAHDNLAPNFQSFLIEQVLAKVAAGVEEYIWSETKTTTVSLMVSKL